ncbi:MAG: NAD(P)-dependent oxidoreductase, partial [Deinococcales bacterium]
MKRVLVTGGAGYIGSTLVRQLLQAGYRVRVLDNLSFGGESILDLLDSETFEFVHGDVRDEAVVRSAVSDCHGVIHLAGIVGDPACARQPDLARDVNENASKQLYHAAEEAGVERFVFASTCSNYGRMEDADALLTEEAPLRPVSLYAESKVAVERFLLDQPRNNGCAPTSLRFSTVYGIAPRVRFDLTVNEFTRELVLGRELVVFGEQFWRPYCHVRDLARSALAVLDAPREAVAFDVFNVGSSDENYRKQRIVELILEQVPGGRV